MKKVLKFFSIVVIILFVLSVFGWMVFHMSKGNKDYGFLTKPVKHLISFPDLFSQSVEEVKSLPKTFVKTPVYYPFVNQMDFDLFVLTAYSDTGDIRTIDLMNLKNDSVYYKWRINNPYEDYDRVLNPILFPGKQLVYIFDGRYLARIDSLSNTIWKQDSIWPNHAMNLDDNGDIWVCSFAPVYYATGSYKLDGRTVFYKDNYIAKVDANTGHILFQKSLTEIFRENNMAYYILKSGAIKDPIHINDIQPALKSTKYYKTGDLFISMRQPSLIIQYRPSTNRVIRTIEGPFVSQHDVDFYNDTTLVFFNNNYYTVASNLSENPPMDSGRLAFAGDFYSDIVRYDFYNDSISFIGSDLFRKHGIFSFTEGLVEFLDSATYFVEEQNTGELWVIRGNDVIYRNIHKSQHEGYHHLSNWTRIVENYE